MNAGVEHIEPAVEVDAVVHDLHLRSVRSLCASRHETAPGAVHVHPELDGRGIGSAPLAHVVSETGSSADGTVLLESTLTAVGFHARHGFDALAQVRDFDFSRPEPSVVTGTP